jgi:hypothetical protein
VAAGRLVGRHGDGAEAIRKAGDRVHPTRSLAADPLLQRPRRQWAWPRELGQIDAPDAIVHPPQPGLVADPGHALGGARKAQPRTHGDGTRVTHVEHGQLVPDGQHGAVSHGETADARPQGLRSPHGTVLGTAAVVDEQPRMRRDVCDVALADHRMHGAAQLGDGSQCTGGGGL